MNARAVAAADAAHTAIALWRGRCGVRCDVLSVMQLTRLGTWSPCRGCVAITLSTSALQTRSGNPARVACASSRRRHTPCSITALPASHAA
jgi:hypothetical protein